MVEGDAARPRLRDAREAAQAVLFGLRGLSHIVSTGCTSSTDAIAYAAQHIALGRQDMMLSGGVDAPLAPQRLTAPPDGRVGGPGHHVGRARHRRHERSWPYTASPVTHVAGTPAARARASRAWAHG